MPRVRSSTKTYAAPALDKAFEILALLADYPDGALVKEMSAALGRSVGELFRIVVVMEQAGLLNRSEVTDRYTVSYKILDLAYRSTPARNLVGAAQPEMQRLARETGQSCHLVVVNGAHGLVIAREENPGQRGFALRLGAQIDIIKSCSGQVLLAFMPKERAERVIDLAAEAQSKSIDPAWVRENLKTVRESGFDQRRSPITYGVTDISYPVFTFNREVVAALTVPFLELIDGSQRMAIGGVVALLGETAARISATLGYQNEAVPPS